jgi:phosphate-selective porin OprO/OprP
MVQGYLAEQEAKKAAATSADCPDGGYRVGTKMDAKPVFKGGLFPWLETENKDFTLHIGLWTQYDNVFWSQTGTLRQNPGARPGKAQGVASGIAAGGIGDLSDGTYFRRIRPNFEGTFWGTGEYRFIPAFENDQFDTNGFDEVWVGFKDVPLIGTIRVGHVKNQFGIEGDTTASSRCMTFMERSAYSEAIEQNQNFVTGLFLSNNYLDERVTWEAVIARGDTAASTGTFFGDGQWLAQARLTALPIYECEGRNLLHVGISGGWRNGSNNLANSPLRTFQARARPELRDDNPDGSPGGVQSAPDSNSNRLIDTGVIAADRLFLVGSELLYICGPFSLQGEYGAQYLQRAVGVAPAGFTFNPKITPPQDYVFTGGYVQLAYTLTGENRAYDKRFGTLDRTYFRGGPYTNAWLVRDEDGHLDAGWGAWEVAGRYSYVCLNDGHGLNRIQGGTLNGVSLGLNWYLNANLKTMFDWVYDQRADTPKGTNEGYTSGFGMRVQFEF